MMSHEQYLLIKLAEEDIEHVKLLLWMGGLNSHWKEINQSHCEIIES